MITLTPEPQRAGEYANLQDGTKRAIYSERQTGVMVGAMLREQMQEYCTPQNLYVLFRLTAMYDQAMQRLSGEKEHKFHDRKLRALANATTVALDEGGAAWTVRREQCGHVTDWVVADVARGWEVLLAMLSNKRRRSG